MVYSVNWPTKVVTIPKADLTVVTASPEVYELDVVTFWQNIHDIQDGEGITYDTIMRSNAPVTISGVTYVRSVEVINGYTIEFEDGQYQVNLVGANNNLLDARVQNQVSLNPSNSGGAVVVEGNPSGLTDAQEVVLSEIWARLGLDVAKPLVTTPNTINFGGGTIDLAGDAENSSTATRL